MVPMSAMPDCERLRIEPLTRAAFAPFGEVIETAGAEMRLINGGTTKRFHRLATTEVAGHDARIILSLFRGQPRAMPYTVDMMERHPLGTQAFYPLSGRPWLVVVAPDDNGQPARPRVFLAGGDQGVQYGRNVWHHPLMALDAVSDFLVADHDGPADRPAADNLEEFRYAQPYIIVEARLRDKEQG